MTKKDSPRPLQQRKANQPQPQLHNVKLDDLEKAFNSNFMSKFNRTL